MAAVLKFSAQFQSPFTYADFDKKVLKRFLRKQGGEVAKTAKSLLKPGGPGLVSEPHQNPLVQSGVTLKAIKAKPSRSGFSVTIAPFKTAAMGKDFYPAATFYGHRGPGKGAGGTRRRREKNIKHGKVAAPRNNYIIDAVKQHEDAFKRAAVKAMEDSIVAKTGRFK